MSRRAAAWLLAGGLVASLPLAAQARTLDATTLTLNDTLAKRTTIDVDPTLRGAVRATLDGDESCLSFYGTGDVTIDTSGCETHVGRLTIDMPPGMALTITQSGSGAIFAGDLQDRLTATIRGDGLLRAGRVDALNMTIQGSGDAFISGVASAATLNLVGSGDARLDELGGPLTVQQTGSGDVSVARIHAPAADVQLRGSGDVVIGDGTIGEARVMTAGSGDFYSLATLQTADVSAFGGGDVHLNQVSGSLKQTSGDGSDIYVGGDDLASTVASKLADLASHAAESDDSSTYSWEVPDEVGHFFTLIFVLAVAYVIFRAVQRGGGVRPLMTRFNTSSLPTGSATDPRVVDCAELMVRLEQRLARVESYVTSREFELNRGFKNL